jgi:hypothetical protein
MFNQSELKRNSSMKVCFHYHSILSSIDKFQTLFFSYDCSFSDFFFVLLYLLLFFKIRKSRQTWRFSRSHHLILELFVSLHRERGKNIWNKLDGKACVAHKSFFNLKVSEREKKLNRINRSWHIRLNKLINFSRFFLFKNLLI